MKKLPDGTRLAETDAEFHKLSGPNINLELTPEEADALKALLAIQSVDAIHHAIYHGIESAKQVCSTDRAGEMFMDAFRLNIKLNKLMIKEPS